MQQVMESLIAKNKLTSENDLKMLCIIFFLEEAQHCSL